MQQFDKKLDRKNLVMITGAAGGLGKAFAVECASRGWNLFLTDLSAQNLETLARGLRNGYDTHIITHACDLTDPASRSSLFETIRCGSMRFSILINVAGIDYEGPFYEQTSLQIRTILRLNIEGTLEMTRAMLEYRNPLTALSHHQCRQLGCLLPDADQSNLCRLETLPARFLIGAARRSARVGCNCHSPVPGRTAHDARVHKGDRSARLVGTDDHAKYWPSCK
jgi:NAD(P)-dependent dehydrogenase (short-subunit alcohol dehydrogenase family)